MKPLRAFLIAQGSDGQWVSTAFRELEPLLDAAKAALALESQSAAVHVGFWRPETHKVADLTRAWPGTLLLSESAIGSLPPPIRVSHAPVGEVDGLSFRVALDGFGYQIEDPSPGNTKKKPLIRPDNADGTCTPRGWVEQLILHNPETAELLQVTGIWDEESFQEKEVALSGNQRLALAMYRYEMVVGEKVSGSNILSNLHACPRWYLDDNLKGLDLTVRLRNVCVAHDLKTINDLANKGYNGLLRLPNLGQGSVYTLAKVLWEAFINGDALKRRILLTDPTSLFVNTDETPGVAPSLVKLKQLPVEQRGQEPLGVDSSASMKPWSALHQIPSWLQPRLQTASFIDGFIDALQPLDQLKRGILVARIGFRCEPHTLEQVGAEVGLTRERVRQIESKIYTKIRRQPFWTELADRLTSHIEGRKHPLLLNGISAIDPWFKGVEELEHALGKIFHHFLNDDFSVIDIDKTPILTNVTQEKWNSVIASGKSMLQEMAQHKVTEEYAKVQVKALLGDRDEDLHDDLWKIVETFALWSKRGDNERILIGFGWSAETLVTAVLEDAGKPLHFKEIHRRANLISDSKHEERHLHNAARSVGVLYGQGTYGLLSHCPLNQAELSLVEAEVEDIASGGEPDKQWHTSELLDELLDRGLDFDGKLTKYVIQIALRNSNTFSNMKRMVWGYKDAWVATAASRLDMRQAVMTLLEEAGRPMNTAEIRGGLQGGRGVNSHFQIHPQGNLIRIGAGLWGLADRDIKVDDPDAVLDRIIEHVEATGEGIHVSEVAALLGNLSDDDTNALLGIIKRKGLRSDRGQYIYLAEWGESRRVWPAVAVHMAMKEHGHCASLDQICETVNGLTKRVIGRIYVGQILASSDGYLYEQQTGLWHYDLRASTETEEDQEETTDT